MTGAHRAAMYAGSGLILAAFSPAIPFLYLAAAGVILIGLVLVDAAGAARRRR